MQQRTEQLASRTRTNRRLHRFVAVPMFGFMFLIGLSGLLLGWKKQVGLSPSTSASTLLEAKNWIPIDSLQNLAIAYVKDSLRLDAQIDRIDIRPEKGIAKVVFTKHYTELQFECATGKLLSIEQRMNDFVEHLHDGTIVDRLLGTTKEQAKISYTTLTSLALMLLSFSGFWMWLNPRRIRKMKNAKTS